MRLLELGDRLWENYIKPRSRRLQLADQIDDQTHVHHALVTVLVFGTLAVLGATVAMLAVSAWLGTFVLSTWVFGIPLRYGIAFGWAFYFVRELVARVGNWRYKTWDGICDVLVPLWVTAPVLFHSVVLLWVLSALVAMMYFLFRPLE
jgi:hypothetical protein